MKRYKQGDQRTFTSDMEEYKNLEDFAAMLTDRSPNKHVYKIVDVYFDIGLDWMWTTIIDNTTDCQVLNPRMWIDIVNRDISYRDLVNEFFSDKYCLDKKEQ